MLNKWNLQAAQFVSKESSRYTLNGIHVRSDATVATNGHYLAWVSTSPDRKAEDFPLVDGVGPATDSYDPFLLDRDAALEIAKALPKKTTIPVLAYAAVSVEDGKTAITVTDLENPRTFRPRKMEGQFPRVEAVFPTKAPVVRFALSATYLAQIAKFAADFNAGREASDPVYITVYSPEDAVRFDVERSDTEQGATFLLMPIRMEKDDVPYTYGWKEREAARVAEAAQKSEAEGTEAAAEADTVEEPEVPAE
jgi:hypothetical protein